MKRCARFAAFCALSLVTLTWLAPSAHAVENEIFGLTPQPERFEGKDRTSFSIPLESGETFEDSIRVYNRTDQPLELAIYATDANTAGADTSVTVGLQDDKPKGVGAWIDLEENELTLPGRGQMSVMFRVEVESTDPSPELGAIVVEPTGQGLSTQADNNRLSLVVRTVPSDSPTTSVRVRSFLRVGSPWIIVAIIGLVVAIVVIVIGTRRARRPKDAVVPAGDIEPLEDELDSVPEASRPVIRRLGERADDGKPSSRTGEVPAVKQARRSTTVRRLDDDRPFLDDDMLVEVDEVDEDDEVGVDEVDEDEDLPPARSRPAPSKTRQPARSTQIPRLSQQKRSRQPVRKTASPKPKATAKSAKSKAAKRTSAAKRKPKKVVRKPVKKAQPPKGFIPLDDL